jgi:acyl-coenzyme A synthetase/AMP-(fatty) acid ligase
MSQPYQIGDYAETYRTFRQTVPERYNWAYEVFDEWGKDPAKVAMLWVDPDGHTSRSITFAEMSERSKRVANALTGLGAKRGDRVFIMLHRVAEWWEIMLGCMRSGVIPVPGTTLLTTKDIAYRINVSDTTIAITDPENHEKLDAVRAECPTLKEVVVVGSQGPWHEYEGLLAAASPELPHPNNLSADPLNIYFTSGTTGHPKMVLNTHATYPIGHVATGKFWLDNRPTDLHWTLADTGWAQASWTSFYAPWNMGAAVFIWDQRGRFSARETMDIFERFPITTFFAPPTVYRMMVLEDLTEFRPGSMGVTAPGYYMAVVDEQGNELPDGTEGELAVKTEPEWPVGLFPEYWRNPEANAKAFHDGWYYTGDLVSRDKDGYFWFVGRADDVIISASYRIGPFEVESALLEHPAVAEAAVVGKPHPLRGSIVKAFVVLTETNKPTDDLVKALQDHVKNVTAPYKYPREIEFMADLPKTISGKIRRNELRRRDQ